MNAGRAVVALRGGGDLGTGVAARLQRCGFAVVVLEIPRPLTLRRLVALAEAVYAGQVTVEDLSARLCPDPAQVHQALDDGIVPVIIDPQGSLISELKPAAVIDARMRKQPADPLRGPDPMIVGLGPGLTAGLDCHALVETNRGHHMGRVIWQGCAEPDTGRPEPVAGVDADRVLRAPRAGRLEALAGLGEIVEAGQPVARIDGEVVRAPFAGVLRGLVHDGLQVSAGMKIGDLDPRRRPEFSRQISDKALAVGGGVLEALLSRPSIRRMLAASGEAV
jgi:xanthine dehydrogenase accessory factor